VGEEAQYINDQHEEASLQHSYGEGISFPLPGSQVVIGCCNLRRRMRGPPFIALQLLSEAFTQEGDTLVTTLLCMNVKREPVPIQRNKLGIVGCEIKGGKNRSEVTIQRFYCHTASSAKLS
jgi:hypothetical protein